MATCMRKLIKPNTDNGLPEDCTVKSRATHRIKLRKPNEDDRPQEECTVKGRVAYIKRQ